MVYFHFKGYAAELFNLRLKLFGTCKMKLVNKQAI